MIYWCEWGTLVINWSEVLNFHFCQIEERLWSTWKYLGPTFDFGFYYGRLIAVMDRFKGAFWELFWAFQRAHCHCWCISTRAKLFAYLGFYFFYLTNEIWDIISGCWESAWLDLWNLDGWYFWEVLVELVIIKDALLPAIHVSVVDVIADVLVLHSPFVHLTEGLKGAIQREETLRLATTVVLYQLVHFPVLDNQQDINLAHLRDLNSLLNQSLLAFALEIDPLQLIINNLFTLLFDFSVVCGRRVVHSFCFNYFKKLYINIKLWFNI